MRSPHARIAMCVLVLGCVLSWAQPASATSMLPRTVVELIDLSEYIITGEVIGLSDGFDVQGVPYTEVTIDVSESLKGNVGSTYTFRQFGLMQPRELPNGQTYLGVSPEGWPRFKSGEKVLLFLYKAAELTGLRTTVGLFQGKFVEVKGGFENPIANRGLFKDVQVQEGLLNEAEAKMLRTPSGPVAPEVLRSFVKKAVAGKWIEEGRVSRVQ